MPKFTRSLLLICLALLVACRQSVHVADTGSLSGLQALANVKSKGKKNRATSNMREMALREIALSLGAQAGLACRANMINKHLTKQARVLDTVFDFNSLVLAHNILPPVLLEGRNTLNVADTQTIRISDRTYKLAKQARFITTPPTWREYLWMDYKQPDPPNLAMLPKTKAERKAWRTCVARGWKNGIEQANTILEESIARIKEDYTGMILYRKLLAMNMVSAPFVASTELGVTGDASEIHIDDRVLRITALPGLNINSNEWRAAVAKDENALEHFKNMEKLAQSAQINISSRAWQPVIAPINEKKY
ncbi:defect in organelle trafficking lipoprotein DotC [Legionella beliardensis]|uniref:Defect in organelle trafficking lipoprotein DotC n=1 Tax=Legionella beliardensis TaxID=91822 RepID=A0A378I592_9GAMM|nr:type IV secretion system DotC family protein [Legionella beliardensis]STX29841.1 defect in organelle trafficking lipoprotein DotC [Legionella beliardensis]